MAVRYKGWRIFDPTINTLADGSGYTLFNVDIARESGPVTEVKSLWAPGRFPTTEAARKAGIYGGMLFIDGM